MTFATFETLVKKKHPAVEIFKHGEFAGSKINVAIVFKPNGKVYQYNGTYCEVLNKLGIPSIYKHDYEAAVSTLTKYKALHGTQDEFFGIVFDYSREIEEHTNRLNDFEQNYIIV
jgi:hypothetical protein